MKAIILAAGRGSRMKSLTDERPKCLTLIGGKTLLDWQLEAIRDAGMNEIGIITGYKFELLKNFNLTEFYNPRWAETNMVSSLFCAQGWLKSGPCIVSYSDIFFDSSAIKLLIDSPANLTITYDKNWKDLWTKRFGNPLLDAETFQLDHEGFLLKIGCKPNTIEEIQGQYMGLLTFSPEGWGEISRIYKLLTLEERNLIHMTGILQKTIDAGSIPIKGISFEGNWGEIDSPEDLALYDDLR